MAVGVGGYLFVIVADKSVEWGYEGAVHGFAANEELLKHYINVFHAEYWECFISINFLFRIVLVNLPLKEC